MNNTYLIDEIFYMYIYESIRRCRVLLSNVVMVLSTTCPCIHTYVLLTFVSILRAIQRKTVGKRPKHIEFKFIDRIVFHAHKHKLQSFKLKPIKIIRIPCIFYELDAIWFSFILLAIGIGYVQVNE